jgi:hypothetical protein
MDKPATVAEANAEQTKGMEVTIELLAKLRAEECCAATLAVFTRFFDGGWCDPTSDLANHHFFHVPARSAPCICACIVR